MAAATPAAPAGTHARSEAQAIAEICLIAGCPDRTAEFLTSSVSEAQVRRALLDARADQPEIASREVLLPGANGWKNIEGGEAFEVPANSKFGLRVRKLADYCCSFVK